ncbi:putative gustatory receptor 9a [Drosophila guanche]|uniref:Gustatory receptor n=1 Tax=Drosophila guanche TaxID=7266 RepID=A0A3B0J879_DROGU|nr:putative gustatory receptor 9a [Drosophila guanche]SPP78045.1 blast:Putative gustatory receptor 9a [Drosophila guanche]
MSADWLERCLGGYFQLLGLRCSYSNRRVGRLLSSLYLVLVIIDLLVQMRNYGRGEELMIDRRLFFPKAIQAVNVFYKLVHALIALFALIGCRRERHLLQQLPPTHATAAVNRLVALELLLVVYALTIAITDAMRFGQFVENLRYIFSSQAVRARYLQMLLLVRRLQAQLEQLQRQLINCSLEDYPQLRSAYAHLARLCRSLSQLYGPSLLLLNVLVLGDFLIVCNVYFMVGHLESVHATWLVFWQAVYVVVPTLVKIWTVCAACDRFVAGSKILQRQLSEKRGGTSQERSQIEEFSLQIMQDALQFNVCGIYHLNLQTLAAMFFFILEVLVIFLQFVTLIH